MLRRMPEAAELVSVVREFLQTHQLMGSLFERYRGGTLRFGELEALVSDDESSLLYRLKERCHGLFRTQASNSREVAHQEALFDLAVGSLFHEAMKFRESFYQREIYGPRMRELRSEAAPSEKGLFEEFERILAAGTARLEEGLQETEALLRQTREQLRILLRHHRSNGLLSRYLVEQPELVEAVFGGSLDDLLADLHGDAATGWEIAGVSYIASGYYDAADRALSEALRRGGSRELLDPQRAYAKGMSAYLSGNSASALKHLRRWVEAGAPGAALHELARAALSRIAPLAPDRERAELESRASELLARLAPAS